MFLVASQSGSRVGEGVLPVWRAWGAQVPSYASTMSLTSWHRVENVEFPPVSQQKRSHRRPRLLNLRPARSADRHALAVAHPPPRRLAQVLAQQDVVSSVEVPALAALAFPIGAVVGSDRVAQTPGGVARDRPRRCVGHDETAPGRAFQGAVNASRAAPSKTGVIVGSTHRQR